MGRNTTHEPNPVSLATPDVAHLSTTYKPPLLHTLFPSPASHSPSFISPIQQQRCSLPLVSTHRTLALTFFLLIGPCRSRVLRLLAHS